MDWWQILLIILGALVAGGLVGGLVSYLISFFTKKPFFGRTDSAPLTVYEPVESGRRKLFGSFTSKSAAQDSPAFTEPGPTAAAVPPAPAPANQPEATPVENPAAAAGPSVVTADLLAEIEQNSKLAVTPPSSDKLVPFQTKVWDLSRNGLQTLPVNVREDLTQAYVDIRLANSIVWLSAELGRRSPNLDESYTKLCHNIAIRLNRVSPQLK